eukprot:scpid99822/ scgid4108/ 
MSSSEREHHGMPPMRIAKRMAEACRWYEIRRNWQQSWLSRTHVQEDVFGSVERTGTQMVYGIGQTAIASHSKTGIRESPTAVEGKTAYYLYCSLIEAQTQSDSSMMQYAIVMLTVTSLYANMISTLSTEKGRNEWSLKIVPISFYEHAEDKLEWLL